MVQKLNQELETLRHEFYQFQIRADAEKKSVEYQLAKAKQDISTIQGHSKTQSQRVQALQDSVQVYIWELLPWCTCTPRVTVLRLCVCLLVCLQLFSHCRLQSSL